MSEHCPECRHPTVDHGLEDGFCGVCISEPDLNGRCAALVVYLRPNGTLVGDAFERVMHSLDAPIALGTPDNMLHIYVLMLPRSATAEVAVLRAVKGLGLSPTAADYFLADTAGYVLHDTVNLAPWHDQVLLLGSRDAGDER